MTTAPGGSHRRYNPLLDQWVLCSPDRLRRPWAGHVGKAGPPGLPRHDPACYLCPGNVRAGGARNPDYPHTFVFDNDFPALASPAPLPPRHPLLRARPASGTCRVICFTPRHDLSWARMTADAARRAVDVCVDEVARLAAQPSIRYVQLFENRGELMGSSNPHPHAQVWGLDHVPTIPARKDDAQRRYYAQHGGDLLGDYLAAELEAGERIVSADEAWVAVVPFWAVWPFEVLVLPRRRAPRLPDLTAHERARLADLTRQITSRYDHLFGCAFPYSMGWHGQPGAGEAHEGWRLHASYYPPLLRSATVPKFQVGYELTGEPQRDLTPEAAAHRLREQPDGDALDGSVGGW